MDGQAEASNNIDGLADFIIGDADAPEEDEVEQEETQDEAAGESDELEQGAEEEGSDEDQPSGKTFDVKVKGEDGQEVSEKVDEKELVAGYMRNKDYTQKTMRLADTEKQVVTVAQQRIEESREYFMQQAQAARQAIVQLAGLKSEEELYRMSIDDPVNAFQEKQRAGVIGGVLQNLDAVIAQEKQLAEQAKTDSTNAKFAESWKVLQEKGLDREKLTEIYAKVAKNYGVKSEEFGTIMDPGLVLALKDAVAYRELQGKKPQIANKVHNAEKLPSQKKALPQQERINRQLNDKFKSGKANVKDLQSFLIANKM